MFGGKHGAAYVVALTAIGWPGMAVPANFELWALDISLNNDVTLGAGWRLEARDPSLIGKLNLDPTLCPDDCRDLGGDPAPNQRLVDAPGGFFAHNGDDGNLNYDQGDLIAAQTRLANDLNVRWGDAVFKLTTLGFYDAANTDFDEFHPDNFNDFGDTAYQPRFTRRQADVEDEIGNDLDILEAFVSVPFRLFDTRLTFSLGEQRLRWGESTFNVLGSLDEINPPNANRQRFPGADIAAVFEPVGLAVLNANLSANLAVELIYQYDWERVEPQASGSFTSTNDIAGGGDFGVVGLGQFSEDPNQIGTFEGNASLVSNSSQSIRALPDNFGFPEQGGQYGARINWFAENINGGTEFSFYFLNYHSRLPYATLFAADASCLRDRADLPDSGDVPAPLQGVIDQIESETGQQLTADGVSAFVACEGFNGTLNPGGPGAGREPLPIQTIRPYLNYPEDIQMYGLSFNTNAGRWSLAGEYAFRPNLPLLIHLPDLTFAALQPAFPEEDINLALGTIPSNRNAVPDIVMTQYRNDPVDANEEILGFERFSVHQLDFTGIRVFSGSNPIGADQILLLVELGMTHVLDMPDPTFLPIWSGWLNATHPTPGADGTGSGGQPDPRRANPTQQTDNYADDFAMGYRVLARLQYSDLLFGFTFNPIVAFFHDVEGVAPFPIQNFVEGNKRLILGTGVRLTSSVESQVLYESYFGGGDFNNLRDRDNVALSLKYSF